jgi:hypothetical protein
MRSFIIAILIAIMLAFAFALVLNSAQETAEMAFTTESVRLDAASPTLSSKEKIEMTVALLSGGLGILGAILGAIIGAAAVYFATRAQINALRDQSGEERTRFQQRRHQKKYEIALALHLEAHRLALSGQKRIPLTQASRPGSGGRAPPREQMTIPVFPILRGEREDIGLLRDDLQDEARDLVKEVDDYNSHIETLARTTGGPLVVDQDGDLEKKLIHLRDKAQSVAQKFNDFISKVRAWRCTRCGAFIDEILDTIEDGQKKRCPLCNNTTRTIVLTPAPFVLGSSLSAQAST